MAITDIMETLEAERLAALPTASDIVDYRNYSNGRQKIDLAPGEIRVLQNALKHDFCDNLCARALEALSNPLRITRWEVAPSIDRAETQAEDVQKFVDDVAMLNKLPTLAKAVHTAMLRDRDHYVALKWYQPDPRTPGRVLLQREGAWNGKAGTWVIYDDDDRVRYAAKEWAVTLDDGPASAATRRVIWWPDRVERYVSQGAGAGVWQEYDRPDLGLPAVSPWLDTRGQPMNPPIVHFANAHTPNDGAGDGSEDEPDNRYGASELEGGVLGIQDAVNKIHRDVLASANFLGFPMVGMSGVQASIDSTGAEVPFVVEPGAVWRSDNPQARFEILAAQNVNLLEQALLIELKAFSRMTGVPVHSFTGQWPSGTALILSMFDYFDKLNAIINSVSPDWGSVMHKATKIANTFGKAGLDEAAPIRPVFAPVVRYDPLTMSSIATAIAPFVSAQEVLRVLAYTPEEVTRIMAEKEEERASTPAPLPAPPVVVTAGPQGTPNTPPVAASVNGAVEGEA